MTGSQDFPQKEDAINTPGPSRPTMAATDSRERGMSPDEQTLYSDAAHGARTNRRVIAGAGFVTLLAAAGIVAIVTSGGKSHKPQTHVSTSPTVAPSQQTPEDLAVLSAEGRYREFLRVRDEVGQAGYRSSAPFDAVAVSPERTVQEISVRKARGLREVGSTSVVSIKVLSVDLSPAAGSYPAVILKACIDVSGVDVLDGRGKSVVSPTRVPRSRSTVTMYKYAKGTRGAVAGGWFVFQATSKGEPC
jgi:hypothetical protein